MASGFVVGLKRQRAASNLKRELLAAGRAPDFSQLRVKPEGGTAGTARTGSAERLDLGLRSAALLPTKVYSDNYENVAELQLGATSSELCKQVAFGTGAPHEGSGRVRYLCHPFISQEQRKRKAVAPWP